MGTVTLFEFVAHHLAARAHLRLGKSVTANPVLELRGKSVNK